MKKAIIISRFSGGLSSSEKEGSQGSFLSGQKLSIFGDPSQMTVLPAPSKVSGSVVVDLIKWIVPATPDESKVYYYGDTGRIYRSNTNGTSFELIRIVGSSNGQGMWHHDGYIYYTQNTQVGRYNITSGTFTDAWQTGLTDTSSTKFAPGLPFKEGFAVGHGNKLAWWDGSVWTLAKLTLPAGLQIRCLEIIDEFIVMGTWRGTAITDNEEGFIFAWDGSSVTFNNFYTFQEGGIGAMLNSRNRLLTMGGSDGYLYSDFAPFNKLQQIPKLTLGKYLEVFPGAMSNWRSTACIGVSANTDSIDILQGVYQWSSRSSAYPEALNYAFPISTGTTTGTGLKIGAVKGAGNNLYIGWKDGSSYGVDRVVNSAAPYSQAIYESLIIDDGNPAKIKSADFIKASHLPLVSGESIQLGYKTDRASAYTTGTANSTVGSTETRLPIDDDKARFHEFQLEVILNAGATAPTVTSANLVYDDGSAEDIY